MKRYGLFFLAVAFCSSAVLFAQDQESVWNSSDEAYLIQVIEKPGDAPDDIFLKNLACKRLAVIGTEKAIPALAAMLPNEKLNLNARTALEAMPGTAVDDALIASLSELQGIQLVGVIDTLAIRSVPAAVAPLAELLAKTDDPAVKKAVYNAFGYIATDEAIDALTAVLAKEPDSDYSVNAALADGLLRAAALCTEAGNTKKAAEICAAVAAADLPAFDKNGGLYNALLNQGTAAAEQLAVILTEGNDRDFEVALKTIREYPAEGAEKIVNAVIAVFPKLSAERQILVIAALGDRADDASKKLVLSFVISLIQEKNADLLKSAAVAVGQSEAAISADSKAMTSLLLEKTAELTEAVVKAAGHCGSADPARTYDVLSALYKYDNPAFSYETLTAAITALPDLGDKPAELIAGLDPAALKDLSDSAKQALSAQMKVLELRRIAAAGSDLLAIANADGVDPVLRDQAVAALSEIVPLQDLAILVQALEQEPNEEKVDWYLRAACTRLPREDCAVEVVKMFQAADSDGKAKLINLLKQIGGQTALDAVIAAAYDPETADKATEVLGQWNTPEDAPALAAASLKLAKESPKYKTRAIRAYIRIPRQFDISADEKIAMARVAFDTAARKEDKVLVFEIFRRIIDLQSVNAALSYTDEPGYAENACAAAVFVAEKIQGTSPELQAAMNKVIETSQNQELKDRAAKVLERK